MNVLNNFFIRLLIGERLKSITEDMWIPFHIKGEDSNNHLSIYKHLSFSKKPSNASLALGLIRTLCKLESIHINYFLHNITKDMNLEQTALFVECLEESIVRIHNYYLDSYNSTHADRSVIINHIIFRIFFKANFIPSFTLWKTLLNVIQNESLISSLLQSKVDNQKVLSENTGNPKPMKWAGDKIELFELMDALYRSGKIQGVTQIQMLNCFNFIFDNKFSLKEFEKDTSDLRTKRKKKTIFLMWLANNYEHEIAKRQFNT